MDTLVMAFLIGVVGGLRALTPVAAVSWATHFGHFRVDNTWLSFLALPVTRYLLLLLAIGELVTDKLPMTPSRKAILGLTGRIASGAICGAVFGEQVGELTSGLLAGVAGALTGTFGGYEVRRQLAKAFGRDLPAALLEDAVAIIASVILVTRFPRF